MERAEFISLMNSKIKLIRTEYDLTQEKMAEAIGSRQDHGGTHLVAGYQGNQGLQDPAEYNFPPLPDT